MVCQDVISEGLEHRLGGPAPGHPLNPRVRCWPEVGGPCICFECLNACAGFWDHYAGTRQEGDSRRDLFSSEADMRCDLQPRS